MLKQNIKYISIHAENEETEIVIKYNDGLINVAKEDYDYLLNLINTVNG